MYELVNRIVPLLRKLLPEWLIDFFRPLYHRAIAIGAAVYYRFPARSLTVIAITGTKGKSTSAEMLFAILRAQGYKTALLSTIRFAINDESEPNLYKMTLQGRGFAQAFMRRAVDAGCTHLVIEVTSESVLQYRHLNLDFDGLIVTNIQRDHLERHGGFEKYVSAKRAIVMTLIGSPKQRRVLVANADIPETRAFLNLPASIVIPFSVRDMENVSTSDRAVRFRYQHQDFSVPIAGAFNAENALACIKMAQAFGVDLATCAKGLAELETVRGRVEHIDAGQPFLAVVDYAHTPESLKALYSAFPTHRKICVLGNTGGGRDTWKRPEMGRIADASCDVVILTNEDPYDEDPREIVDAMAKGMERTPTIIMDRREAIRTALKEAKPGDVVLVSGKGTDPYIMGANGAKQAWSDAQVVREELERLRT